VCPGAPPSRPLLGPIERLAPGVPEDDELVPAFARLREGWLRLIPGHELVPPGTPGQRSWTCGLPIPLCRGLHESCGEVACIGRVPSERSGATDVLTQGLFEGIALLIDLYRTSCRGCPRQTSGRALRGRRAAEGRDEGPAHTHAGEGLKADGDRGEPTSLDSPPR